MLDLHRVDVDLIGTNRLQAHSGTIRRACLHCREAMPATGALVAAATDVEMTIRRDRAHVVAVMRPAGAREGKKR